MAHERPSVWVSSYELEARIRREEVALRKQAVQVAAAKALKNGERNGKQLEKGRKEGLKEGQEQGKRDMARLLKRQDIDVK